ncbi:hypothetical protein F0L74_25125 [Chitinophaga agrisoli]|uniref:Uncharacterized protein n=1 Tax=Chitinophaga agrisoli TaxID=2607653 RepID=A0A5B2VMI7_9BACT|nr:hypothetical protein [Chitinophaga agrisoli]KAA2239487.1 hypothetical protein F0L74_25125 [Chitinophaga agrisoli]
MLSDHIIRFLLSAIVFIPLIIGVVRYFKMDTSYHPFILLLLMAFTSEVISFICIHYLETDNAITLNFYVLIECVILLFQFRAWGFLRRKPRLFLFLMVILVIIWIVENLVFYKIETYSPFFKGAYSFVIVLLSINEINYMIVQDNRQPFWNAKFLICLGFIIYFIYQIILEASYYVLETDNALVVATKIVSMFGYINAFVNLLYGVATLLIPDKKKNLHFNRHFD